MIVFVDERGWLAFSFSVKVFHFFHLKGKLYFTLFCVFVSCKDVNDEDQGRDCRMSRHQLSDEDEPDSNVPLLADYDHHGLSGAVHNPPMPISYNRSLSQEVKYTFEPCTAHDEQDTDSNSDYSHISIRPKHSHQDESTLGRPPPYSRHAGGSARFQRGVAPISAQRVCPPYQSVSLEDVSEREQPRGWSPTFWRPKGQGYQYQAGYKNSHGHQSSRTGDRNWPHHGTEMYNVQGYQQGQPHFQLQSQSQDHHQGQHKNHPKTDEIGECVPPRLAPVSGVLSEVRIIHLLIWFR